MGGFKRKSDYFSTEEGKGILHSLEVLAADAGYHTTASYSANSELYPDNLISFVDKHVAYLRNHPNTDPEQYVSNLRLMTRKFKS